jgi:hypothetical protein
MQTAFTFLVRLILVAAGLVVAASLAFAFVLVLAAWGVRAAWCRLTGRPVMPFVMRVDPRDSFQRVYRRAAQGRRTPRADAVLVRRPASDVSDVEPRPPV